MNLQRNIAIQSLLLLTFAHLARFRTTTTISPTTTQTINDCLRMDSFNQVAYEYLCPSLVDTQVLFKIERDKKVDVTCYDPGYDLLSINATIGKVDHFKSKDCDLADRFKELILKWGLNETKILEMTRFSRKGFVLRKEHFFGLDVASVRMVDIERSNILGLDSDTFVGFVSLEKLLLTYNNIRVLPELHLPNLIYFDVGENLLSKLPDRLIMPNLQSLLLWRNEITEINDTFLMNVTNLTVLELMNNKLSVIPEELIEPLVNLEKFGAAHNNLTEIPRFFFRKNKRLQDVRMFGNNIEILPETLFTEQSELKMIDLNDNRLRTLPDNWLKNCRKIQTLNFANNRFSSWRKEWSDNLEELKILTLSGNLITSIASPDFQPLKRLKMLYLNNNNISEIDIGAFTSLELEVLDLSRNNLRDEYGFSFVDGIKTVAKLNLAYNAFEIIPDGMENKAFVDLNMSHNKIKNLQPQMFFNSLKVDFSYNKIENLDFVYINTAYTLGDPLHTKLELNIGNNPIDCGCGAYLLVSFFDGTYNNLTDQLSVVGEPRCQTPPNMQNTPVSTLRSDRFVCNDDEIYECPEWCSCAIHPISHSFNVNCSNRNFTSPPIIPTFRPVKYGDLFTINKLQVDLRNNSIANFTKREASYVNVTDLYLSDNRISLVDWLPGNLEVLELNANKLENLDLEAITTLNHSKALKRITFHDNPWKCNCKLLNFTKWLRMDILKIASGHKIFCANGLELTELVEANLCGFQNQAALIAVGICFFIFLVGIGIALIFYYKYEYAVKVWLYSVPLFRKFVTEDELDKNKIYDAFISYSHKDEDFVAKELQPGLEGGDDPYKLCIHNRDWIVGEFITTQIVESVTNSRRTIIVLSRHFLESEWAAMEFRTAHTQTMKEGRLRLIVILYDDIDPNSIEDPELKAYLSTNTYVRWGDPWFWKKLRYAMPHRNGERNNNEDDANNKKKLKNKRMENIMVSIDKMINSDQFLINSPATPNLGTPPAVSLDPLLIKGNSLAFKANPHAETPPAEAGIVTSENR